MSLAVGLNERAKPPAAVTAMANRFGRYAPENEQIVRNAEVEQNPVIKQLKALWDASPISQVTVNSGQYYDRLERSIRVKKLLGRLTYSAKDIELFSLTMGNLLRKRESFGLILGLTGIKAGFFLSALMNNCEADSFVIHTAHLTEPIHFIGHKNTKDVTVKGDVGFYLGTSMLDGRIRVEGNARKCIGNGMKGGEIHIEGDYESISTDTIHHGKIFLNGKLIFHK